MAILTRMLGSPLFVEIRRGAVDRLAELLTERHISSDGTVLVALGRGQGQAIWATLEDSLPRAGVFVVQNASLDCASELLKQLDQA